MKCPMCGGTTYVVHTWHTGAYMIMRWRKCTSCRFRFRTRETLTDYKTAKEAAKH